LNEAIEGKEIEPVLLLMQQEQVDDVRQAVRELPAHLQEVLVLRFDGGHSQKEIAEIQGVSVSTIKRNLCDAYEQLRRKLRVDNGYRRHPA
jgi:RNA polymerase sigma-70 factor (ECF subfamily)